MDNKFNNKLKSDTLKSSADIVSDDKQENKIELKEGIINLVKKNEKKNIRKPIAVYMETDTTNALNKLSKKTGYSRNELINIFVKYGLENNNMD